MVDFQLLFTIVIFCHILTLPSLFREVLPYYFYLPLFCFVLHYAEFKANSGILLELQGCTILSFVNLINNKRFGILFQNKVE